MVRFRPKHIPSHQAFINKYLRSRYNPMGLYRRIYFCEDEDIAIVARVEDYDEEAEQSDNWGCVNMAHQLLVPFSYEKIIDYGHYLIGETWEGYDLYNKKGQLLYKLEEISRTPHKAYQLLYEDYPSFRISIRKMSISKGLFSKFYVLENGLAFVQKEDEKVGVILFTKLKLPFEYYSIAIPQNGYTLGIIESDKENDTVYYDCQLIKVRNQIKKEDSIHPTGIYLFTRKTLDEVNEYLNDKKRVEKDCNSIICYNEQVEIYAYDLQFFPFDTQNVGEEGEEDLDKRKEYYDEWSPENYSYEDAMYDALGGEMDAIWNID